MDLSLSCCATLNIGISFLGQILILTLALYVMLVGMKVKYTYWLFVFGILSLFTIYAFGNLFYNGNRAYAQTIESTGLVSPSNMFTVFNSDYGQQICTINPQQETKLARHYHVTEFIIYVHGKPEVIAEVQGYRLTEWQLKSYLASIGANINCQIVQYGHIFFLPVIPSVS